LHTRCAWTLEEYERLPYTRGQDAADILERLAICLRLAIVEVNILEGANLYERYKHSIPVVAIAGGPTLAAPIREEELLRWLT
jgi:hypothetical protein